MSEPLDLSGANLSAFDAIPSGTYDCTVYDIEPVTIESDAGKLPQGTPGYNVKFAVQGGEFDGKFVWNRYYFPPAEGYDASKRSNLLGMFANFCIAIGYSEKEVLGGKFKFDINDAKGRECRVVVGQKAYEGEMRNIVKNVKPVGASAEEAGIL